MRAGHEVVALEGAQPARVGEPLDQVGVGERARRRAGGSCRAGGRGGARPPASRGTWWPARGCAPSPDASRRRPSSPRSGSGDADSQSRRSGRSCCIIRDERVRPRVSSATACRVRSTSAKPKAASRSAVAASPERTGAGQRLEQRPEPHPLVGAAHPQPVRGERLGRTPRWARPRACRGTRAPARRAGGGRGRPAPSAPGARPRAARRARRAAGTGRSRRGSSASSGST